MKEKLVLNYCMYLNFYMLGISKVLKDTNTLIETPSKKSPKKGSKTKKETVLAPSSSSALLKSMSTEYLHLLLPNLLKKLSYYKTLLNSIEPISESVSHFYILTYT